MTPEIERKTIMLSEANEEAGTFEGYASVFDTVDSAKETVDRGAFTDALPAFRQDGFISWAHAWDVPVAYPTEVREDSRGLYLRGVFHSTSAAQDARKVTSERLAAGKRMGLSIGYRVADDGFIDGVRHLKRIDPLFEVGLVTVPANRQANVIAATELPRGGAHRCPAQRDHHPQRRAPAGRP